MLEVDQRESANTEVLVWLLLAKDKTKQGMSLEQKGEMMGLRFGAETTIHFLFLSFGSKCSACSLVACSLSLYLIRASAVADWVCDCTR